MMYKTALFVFYASATKTNLPFISIQIDKHLQNLPRLQSIDLHENNINHLSSQTFKGTTALREINLKQNKLSKLDFLTTELIMLRELKKLDVSDNQLDSLENFAAAPVLEQLRMDKNE